VARPRLSLYVPLSHMLVLCVGCRDVWVRHDAPSLYHRRGVMAMEQHLLVV
jgi:hypothetical protein